MSKKMSQEELEKLAMKGLKVQQRQQRQWIKDRILLRKAKDAGLKVSEQEIADYLANEYKK